MESHVVTISFAATEYKRLLAIARRRKRTVKKLVKEAVERAYLKSPPVDFTKLAAFGMWADDPRTDEEILNDLGGNWTNFPLEE